MKEGLTTFAFALFAALLLVGNMFAASATNSATASANKAPVITSVGGPTSISAGTAGTWTVSAYDPDSSYLSYGVDWGDGLGLEQAGQSQTDSIATFQHAYSSAGTYTITFTAKDAKGAQTQSSVTTTVTAASTNHPPAFTSLTCPVTGTSVTCYAYASDPDSDPVTYTVNFGDNTPAVAGMQHVFAHSYQMAGTYTISVEAADNHGAQVGTSLQVTLTGNENQKPIITSVSGPSSLTAGQAGTWTVKAYDPDGTYLSYSVNWGDSGISPSAPSSAQTGSTATFQHTYSSAGTYTITFTVADNLGATAVSASTIAVAGSSGNGCDSSFNQLTVGQMLQVPPMTNTYGVKLIDISADSDRAAMVQILDPNEAVLDYAKVVPGTKYVYAGKSGNLAIETCKAASASSDVNSAWIKGAMTTSPGTDICAGYHALMPSQELDATTFLVRLEGVSAAQGITASQRTARVGILSPLDVLLETKTMAPGSAYTYTLSGTANSVTVKVCDTAYGIAAGTSWAKMSATTASGESTGLKVNRIWTEPDLLNQYSTTIYSEVLDGTQPANPNIVKVNYTFTYPDGSVHSGLVGLNAQNQNYTGKGYFGVDVGAGAPCGTYSLKVSAQRTITSSTQASEPTVGYATFALQAPYCMQTTPTSALNLQVEQLLPDIYKYDGSNQVNGPALRLTAYNGNKIIAKMSSGSSYEADAMLAVLNSATHKYLYLVKMPGYDYYTSAPHFSIKDVSQFNVEELASDSYKYENGGIVTGVSLDFTAKAGYTILAFTASGAKYQTSRLISVIDSQTDQFHYLFKQAGYDYFTTASRFYLAKASSVTTGKLSLKFEPGWNMISVPTEYDIQLPEIQQKCDIKSAWYYNPVLGQYSVATTFGKGMVGVWMKAGSACTYELDAPYVSSWSSPLWAGWNMVGAPASSVSFASVAGNCKVTSGPWIYAPSSGQYVQSSTLEPGKGYWVKVAADCTLKSASDVPPAAPSG